MTNRKSKREKGTAANNRCQTLFSKKVKGSTFILQKDISKLQAET